MLGRAIRPLTAAAASSSSGWAWRVARPSRAAHPACACFRPRPDWARSAAARRREGRPNGRDAGRVRGARATSAGSAPASALTPPLTPPPTSHSAPHRAPAPHRAASRAPRLAPRTAAGAPDKLSGLVFEPFAEVKTELAVVESKGAAGNESLARSAYAAGVEAAFNEQINIEYNISYVYHAMACYFARWGVGGGGGREVGGGGRLRARRPTHPPSPPCSTATTSRCSASPPTLRPSRTRSAPTPKS